MIVLTVDQRHSRTTEDAVGPALVHLERTRRPALLMPPERTAGDEFQVLAATPRGALDLVLDLTRADQWSVGIGVGAVDAPLGATVRECRGPAFVAARQAVERAKRSLTHCALAAQPGHPLADDVEALLALLLLLRARRTPPGWELHDLLSEGMSQQDAAARLGITAQSASQRARTAGLRVEDAATAALVTLLETLDATVSGAEPRE